MNSLSTKQRIFGTIGLLVGSLILVSLLGFRTGQRLENAVAFNYDNYFLAQSWLSEVLARQRDVQYEVVTAALLHDPAAVTSAKQHVASHWKRISELLALYEKTDCTQEELALAKTFVESRSTLVESVDQVLATLSAGDFQAASIGIRERTRPAHLEALDAGDQLLDYLGKRAANLKEESDRTFARDTLVSVMVVALTIVLSLVLGWLFSNSILQALAYARSIAARIASGQLGQPIDSRRSDEFGELLRSLQAMDAKLVEVVSQVRQSAVHVGAAARQIAQGNDDLSSRTQEQAAALEQTAASMEQMNTTVKQNAENSRHASELAISARGQAKNSGEIVERAVNAMTEINQASRKIADIIGVIDEIAFQTNLLALNAAVEAARAGEQGRGFAVVAAEVRTLAQRSAVAAREIKGLITESVEKVNTGSEFVDQSGQALRTIVDGICKVSDIVQEISSASQEQAVGIDQVNNAVSQMDTTTQQNAALVEEASAASKQMQSQAELLINHAEFFRIERQAAPAVAPAEANRPMPISHRTTVQTTATGPRNATGSTLRGAKPHDRRYA